MAAIRRLAAISAPAAAALAAIAPPPASAAASAPAGAGAIAVPEVRDRDLELALFAAEPDIVTPVGVAVDRRGRVFAVESHTHSPRPDYAGPRHDRIKVLEDRDGDGRADRVTVFADGPWQDAMNLAFGPDGVLYVVYQAGVDALADRDGDGRADDRRTVLRLETRQTYDHSGLLGVTVSHDGWLYVSRGNVGGLAYAFVGRDGRRLAGYGDGGNIVRVRPDGGGLELVATGFWNPFDLKLDGAGRLLAVDNDPDSRGPNRLLHVVPGGDYGYRARYGQSGLHPASAWSGELPGTLGFVAGVGESPAGLLDCDTAALPAGYRGGLLVTVWAESSIERFQPQRAGASLTARREILVKGERDFRPVGIAAAPDGSVFVTDWVKKDYPNHGRGRLWRLRARPGVARLSPRAPFATPARDAAAARLRDLAARAAPGDYAALTSALRDDDPFVRAVAVGALARPVFRERLARDLVSHATARVRLGALLALRRAGGAAYPLSRAPPGALARLLGDPDPDVRLMALVWAFETMELEAAPHLGKAIAGPRASPGLVRMYLAARQLLTGDEVRHLRARQPRSSAGEGISPDVVEPVLRDRALAPEILAMALPHLGAPATEAGRALVASFLDHDDLGLRVEAVRSLAADDAPATASRLLDLARDPRQPASLRAEAMAALGGRPEALERLTTALDDGDRTVARLAARLLRAAAQAPRVRAALADRLARLGARPGDPADRALAEDLRFALDPAAALAGATRPRTPAEWQRATAAGGDPVAGRLAFLHPQLACARCHAVRGRGGHIGPDLTHVGASADRARLVDSILNPSEEVSPEFQAYTVVMKDGQTLVGSQFHFRNGGERASLRLVDGRDVVVDLDDVASHEASDTSFMPQGLENAMTVEELRDLVAYLATLR